MREVFTAWYLEVDGELYSTFVDGFDAAEAYWKMRDTYMNSEVHLSSFPSIVDDRGITRPFEEWIDSWGIVELMEEPDPLPEPDE